MKSATAADAERHEETIRRAYCAFYGYKEPEHWVAMHEAKSGMRIIRAAVRAVVPGKQQGKNLAPLMELAVKAAARAIRRAPW